MLPVNRSREEASKFYDRISRVYSLMSNLSEWKYTRMGLQQLSIRNGEKVLEIGFGSGEAILEIARQVGAGGKACGIDISAGMLNVTRKKVARSKLQDRVELRRGDAVALPYDSGSFEAVFMSFTLELFELNEISQVLREIRRVLKPGGRLGVVSISRVKPGFSVRVYEWFHRNWPRYIDCRPIYTEELLSRNGFRILTVKQKTMYSLPVDIITAAPSGN